MEETWFERKKRLIFLAVFVFLILVVLIFFGSSVDSGRKIVEGEIEIHFIDVGQADSTLIIQEGIVVLIDAGHWQRTDVLDYLDLKNISEINLLIGTHPHADHIGQMDSILERFEVQEVWMSGYVQNSNNYRNVMAAIDGNNVVYREPRVGEVYYLDNLGIEILNPERITKDMHESGLAFKVSFGDFSVMFTGDVEAKTEREIIKKSENVFSGFFSWFSSKEESSLDVTVYQLGHHGSKTSSTKEFLEAMSPKIGVYSAGRGNSYGHPDLEVVERFKEMNIPLYGTDEFGTIVILGNHLGEFEIYTEK